MFGVNIIGPSEMRISGTDFVKSIRGSVAYWLRQEGKEVLKSYRNAISTWNHQPEFVVKVMTTVDGVELTVMTDDDIFNYIDNGTSVRYATMTTDFIPKSAVNQLQAYPGAGEVAYISKKVARDGIAARNFTINITKLHQPIFDMRVEEILERETEKWWRSNFAGSK